MKTIYQKKKAVTKAIQDWEKEKPILMAQQDLKEEKKQIKNRYKKQKESLSMSKRLMIFLFVSCSLIELFTLYITLKGANAGFYDFSALSLLITTVVGEVVAFTVYSIKALKENTQGGIVYETALKNTQIENQQEELN